MQGKFFEFKLESKQQQVAIFKEAVNALNQLIEYYQEIENSKPGNTKITIKLQTPWDKVNSWGGDTLGIGGSVLLNPSPGRPFDHPVLIALDDMGFNLGTNYSVNNEFFGSFSVYDIRFIAEIPEKCQAIVETNKQGFVM